MQLKLTDATFELRDGVGRFTMNRPDVLNALTEELRLDFQTMLDFVEYNPDVRALIIRGEGRAFSAGGNVKGMQERRGQPIGPARDRILQLHQWLERLHNLDCPVIAAVDGLAFGGGMALALVADFVLASPRAKFSAVFGRIGLIPDMALLYTLPRAVGTQKAKELMYTARTMEVEEAAALGLVLSVHSSESLDAAANAFAAQLALGSKEAIGLTKRLVNHSLEADYKTMAKMEADGQAMMFETPFHQEAVRRFVEKEPALFNWDQMNKEAAD